MNRLKIILVLACLAANCAASSPLQKPIPTEATVVAQFDEKFPPTPDAVEKFLGEKFIRTSTADHFNFLNTDNWKDAVGLFQEALVAQAKKKELPYSALRRSLDTIMSEREDLAIVPVAAYMTKLAGEEAWIVVCLWENDIAGKSLAPPTLVGVPAKQTPPEKISLGIAHIRVFVYKTKDNALGAFATCL